jgi:ADP-ribose pyrophosphatase
VSSEQPSALSRNIESHFHFCPRCGAANRDCGAVPFHCPHCQYAHFFGPVASVAGLIVNRAGQLLMVRRARDPGQGKWGLPGGFVDRGETMEQAVARETREETGLEIIHQQYLMTYPNLYDYQGIRIPVIDLFFVCRVAEPAGVVLDASELTHFEWLRPSAAELDQMAFHSNRLAIEKWLQWEQPS